MPHLLWDASALTKRYAEEDGSDTVDELFTAPPAWPMAGTFLGYTETYAALWRKRSRGAISAVAFREAASSLRTEMFGRDCPALLCGWVGLVCGAVDGMGRFGLY